MVITFFGKCKDIRGSRFISCKKFNRFHIAQIDPYKTVDMIILNSNENIVSPAKDDPVDSVAYFSAGEKNMK